MRIITVANQKGGCGKTTVVINLAACLAREGRRTLAVDLDPQGHCALGLAVPEEQIEQSIAELLMAEGGEAPDMGRATWQISSNFDLVPARIDLSTLEQRLAGVPQREQRLRTILDGVRDRYDFVLIDSPPTVGFLTQTALNAADEVIVPVDTGYFSLHGLSKQLDTIRALRQTTDRVLTVRILANLYDVRTKLAREILAELRKRHGDAMLTSFVNFNTKLKESSSLGQPITEYDPASIGCRDFVRLARELIALRSGGRLTAPVGADVSIGATVLGADWQTESENLGARLEGASDSAEDSMTLRPAGAAARISPRPAQVRSMSAETVSGPDGKHPLLAQADALADSAGKLLATSETLLGPGRKDPRFQTVGGTGRGTDTEAQPGSALEFAGAAAAVPSPVRAPSPEETQRKIERIYGPHAVADGVIFTIRADGARSVRLAGDFNNWNPDRTPLHFVRDGIFEVKLPLSMGRYQYRYVIDGHWQNDPANGRVITNPYGELNSVVEVG